MKILLVVLIIAALTVCQALQCNTTHFNFLGKYSLGKQDELNRTFTHMQERITVLDNVTYTVNDSTSYTIFNTKPLFYYRDSNQTAEVLGNDTVVVTGGRLDVEFTFEWVKKSLISKNGTGRAGGVSDIITFAKQMVIRNDSFYSYQLLDADDVAWSNGDVFKLRRVDPPTTTDEDMQNLHKLLNNIMSVRTIRTEIEEEIDKAYIYLLRNSLHDEHQPIDVHFDYNWTKYDKTNVTIPFARRPIMIDLEPDGVSFSFEVQIPGYSEWKCGQRRVPHLPLNTKVFGGSQEYIAFDFYQNVLHYAISKNILDTKLNRVNWQSRMFQFFAGDLYEILPKVRQLYYASQPVEGECEATYLGLKVWKARVNTFNVSLHYDCKLQIHKQRVLNFAIGLQMEVEGDAREDRLDFKLRAHDEFISLYPVDIPVENEALAKLMIHHSVNRLYEGHLFGSRWPMSPPRDYPHMITAENYTIVYDSTHIEPDNSTLNMYIGETLTELEE